MRGKVIAVTGGFGVLGRCVATMALDRGARVAILDKANPPPQGLAGVRGGADALILGGVDLSAPGDANDAIRKVWERFGQIDALLNIAGGFRWETVEDGKPETWEFLHRINLLTALNASRAVLPYMRDRGYGRIVNVGAAAALKSPAGLGAYGASKAGVHRLTESLAEETKGSEITVNAVLPSIIDTPTNRSDMPDADFSVWVRPDELAAVMLFLASDEASGVTGALIPVIGRV